MRKINNYFIISLVVTAILIISLIAFIVNKSGNRANENKFAEEMSSFEKTEGASTEIGKTVKEAENVIEFEEIEETKNTTENTISETEKKENTVKATATKTKKEEKKNETSTEQKNETKTTNATETKSINTKFEAPVKGEIIREFAKDSLVFSKTLQEWIVHNGVDIKADKTSVVKSAAAGTVSAIKNDPRYGLTVIINHDDGYQTVYSNLLTAEFVVKGEKVEIGQSIGTVGNTASFESEDECHLHFELLKDNEYLDPTIYVSFE